jgi:hypothetical protein
MRLGTERFNMRLCRIDGWLSEGNVFNPQSQYDVYFDNIPIRDFLDYWEEFVVRPPYQRKTVWNRKKQQALLDSLFRRYYVPRIVIREVRLDDQRTVREVIDGQQRIVTANLFLTGQLPLPYSLADVQPALPGAKYAELPPEQRRFVDRDLKYNADVVKGIDDPKNPEHQRIATEIFWRLQQGESLNYMEIAHARLSSLSRNFIVKYADDIRFDYDTYEPIDSNPDKHFFFRAIDRNNDRMQHLALLSRLLILEESDGLADVRETDVMKFIDSHQVPDGIGNLAYEKQAQAKDTLHNMRVFYDVFATDPMLDGEGLKELRVEYFIISIYLLLRHLRRYYVFDAAERELFRKFVIDFHERWRALRGEDSDILIFAESRQHNETDIRIRHQILRQLFFDYASEQGHDVLTKDERRVFNEAERIFVYRMDEGLCQVCLEEGKSEIEARVPWREYDADHIVPHAKGGPTDVTNAQVLCRYHNKQKGASVP